VGTTALFWRFNWERDGSHVFYQDMRDPVQTTFRLDPVTGAVVPAANCSRFIHEGALRCIFEGQAPDGALMFSVVSSWANVYAFDVELP
jgi:hypothetical protein